MYEQRHRHARFLADGSVLTFGSPTANSQINFTNSIDLNGETRQVDVAAGAGGDSASISGDIIDSQGGAGLFKTGNGTLILTGSNSYCGADDRSPSASCRPSTASACRPPRTSSSTATSRQTDTAAFCKAAAHSTAPWEQGAGQVQWVGDGGFSANGGPLTVSLVPVQDVKGNAVSPGSPLVWGNSSGFGTSPPRKASSATAAS